MDLFFSMNRCIDTLAFWSQDVGIITTDLQGYFVTFPHAQISDVSRLIGIYAYINMML